MNGKKAKRLRRQAEELTVGKPTVNYLQHKKTGQVILGGCTRKVYKFLKKQAKGENTRGMVTPAG